MAVYVHRQWEVSRLCYEADTEPYAKIRDAAVSDAAAAAGVAVHSPTSHTLYDPAELARKNGGAPPLTYQSFLKLLDKVGPPPAPLEAPSSLPPPLPDAAAEVTTLTPTLYPTLSPNPILTLLLTLTLALTLF